MQLCLLGSHACPPTPRIRTSYHQRRLPMIPVIWSLLDLPSGPPVQMGVTVENLMSGEFAVMPYSCNFVMMLLMHFASLQHKHCYEKIFGHGLPCCTICPRSFIVEMFFI